MVCHIEIKDEYQTLECFEKIKRARINALKILQQRQFNIPNSLFVLNDKVLIQNYKLFLEKSKNYFDLDISIPNQYCYAKISWIKTKADAFKAIMKYKTELSLLQETLYKNNSSFTIQNSNLIIILVRDCFLEANDYFHNKINLENNFVSYFSLKNLQVNIIEHQLVPKHELLNKRETDKIIKRYRFDKNKSCFPSIIRYAYLDEDGKSYTGDPIARYLGLKTDDIIKITRKSPSGGTYLSYRQVKDSSNHPHKDISDLLGNSKEESLPIDSKIDLGKLYFVSKFKNSSYSGYSLNDLMNKLEESVLNKDKNVFLDILKEINSFNILIVKINECLLEYNKLNKLSLKNKYLLRRVLLPNENIPRKSLKQWINNKQQILFQQCLSPILQFSKKIYAKFYLNTLLITKISEDLSKVPLTSVPFSNLDSFYSLLWNIYSPFLSPNIQPNLMIKGIVKLFILPLTNKEVFNYNEYFIRISSKLSEITGYKSILKYINTIKQKTISQSQLEKYNSSDYSELKDIIDLHSHPTIKTNALLLYESLLTPTYIKDIPGLCESFIYIHLLLTDNEDNNTFYLDMVIKIIYKTIIAVLETNKDKYQSLKQVVLNSEKWLLHPISNRNFIYLYNIILLVIYRNQANINLSFDLIETPQVSLYSKTDISTKITTTPTFSSIYQNPIYLELDNKI